MTYVMDTVFEGARIEQKTDRDLTLAQLQWAGVAAGQSVLDLGCAAGTTTRIIANIVGARGRAVGIDLSTCRLKEATRHPQHAANTTYRQGDAMAIPANDGEFDVTWSRFVFEYLTDPMRALTEMIRVTSPGGVVCVSDLDGNCIWHHPMDGALRCRIDDALRTLGSGFHPNVGREIFSLFVDAGLRDIDIDVRPYHVIAGQIDAEERAQWSMKLEGVAHALTQRGWTTDCARQLCSEFFNMLVDPRCFTYSVLISVRGTVPNR